MCIIVMDVLTLLGSSSCNEGFGVHPLLVTAIDNEFPEIGFFGLVTDPPHIHETAAFSLATIHRIYFKIYAPFMLT